MSIFFICTCPLFLILVFFENLFLTHLTHDMTWLHIFNLFLGTTTSIVTSVTTQPVTTTGNLFYSILHVSCNYCLTNTLTIHLSFFLLRQLFRISFNLDCIQYQFWAIVATMKFHLSIIIYFINSLFELFDHFRQVSTKQWKKQAIGHVYVQNTTILFINILIKTNNRLSCIYMYKRRQYLREHIY